MGCLLLRIIFSVCQGAGSEGDGDTEREYRVEKGDGERARRKGKGKVGVGGTRREKGQRDSLPLIWRRVFCR